MVCLPRHRCHADQQAHRRRSRPLPPPPRPPRHPRTRYRQCDAHLSQLPICHQLASSMFLMLPLVLLLRPHPRLRQVPPNGLSLAARRHQSGMQRTTRSAFHGPPAAPWPCPVPVGAAATVPLQPRENAKTGQCFSLMPASLTRTCASLLTPQLPRSRPRLLPLLCCLLMQLLGQRLMQHLLLGVAPNQRQRDRDRARNGPPIPSR